MNFSANCACCEPTLAFQAPALGRRKFLAGGVAALGLGALGSLGSPAVRAQGAKTKIDVHHHFVSPDHREYLSKRKVNAPKWSAQMSLDDMDKSGIATSVLSPATPGTWWGEAEDSRKMNRIINDFGAKLVRDHPGRFGLFATISPPDADGSLKEIEYAFDILKADGISFFTSYGGKYLGDASFVPVYAELNRRKAVIYVHPAIPACCSDVVPGIPVGSIEYATDSTRTIAHLVFSGMSQKYPDIRWIFSHSGGTLPFLTARFIQQQKVQKNPHLPNGPMPEFQKLYYELAQGHTKAQLSALFEMVQVSQVLYGTDYPYREGADTNEGIANWRFNAAELRSIEVETARKLLPNLKTA
ncbi:MAG: amidohydrolase family protein [Alphaproteobacteria bacterium]|nr:amidohydrolase family protein [Alphaproteobacteria bacterium]